MSLKKALLAASLLTVTAVYGLTTATLPVHAQALRPATLQRTTLVVGDIEKSLDFYQRIGLVKLSDTAGADGDKSSVYGSADLPLTADSKSSRLIILKAGDTASVALLWYDRPQLPSARGNLVGIGSGDVIVNIEVPDLQAAYGRLGQIGTRFQRQPSRFNQVAPDGTQLAGQHVLAYDPDGHMIEISQMDKK